MEGCAGDAERRKTEGRIRKEGIANRKVTNGGSLVNSVY